MREIACNRNFVPTLSLKLLPLRSSRPYGSRVGHIESLHKTGRGPCRNRGSCDRGITLQRDRDFGHMPKTEESIFVCVQVCTRERKG